MDGALSTSRLLIRSPRLRGWVDNLEIFSPFSAKLWKIPFFLKRSLPLFRGCLRVSTRIRVLPGIFPDFFGRKERGVVCYWIGNKNVDKKLEKCFLMNVKYIFQRKHFYNFNIFLKSGFLRKIRTIRTGSENQDLSEFGRQPVSLESHQVNLWIQIHNKS